MRVKFPFPAEHAIYDDFTIQVNGVAAPRGGDLTKEVESDRRGRAERQLTLDVSYRSRGLDDWRYGLAEDRHGRRPRLRADGPAQRRRVDFPAGTMSPTARPRRGTDGP